MNDSPRKPEASSAGTESARIEPMLARAERTLPIGGYSYEPKWDGVRAMIYRDIDEVPGGNSRGDVASTVRIVSRNGRRMDDHFPEVVRAVRALPGGALTLDGELMIRTSQRFDPRGVVLGPGSVEFNRHAVVTRLNSTPDHAAQLARTSPAIFVAYDILRRGEQDLVSQPFHERRATLESVFRGVPAPLAITVSTLDPKEAMEWLRDLVGGGIDGVVAKRLDAMYLPGKRNIVKVKLRPTIDYVVGGFRLSDDAETLTLKLGLYNSSNQLSWVQDYDLHGDDVGTAFRLLENLAVPRVHHPWGPHFAFEDWVPVRPALVCEIPDPRLADSAMRRPREFKWRPDRAPESCLVEQLAYAPLLAADPGPPSPGSLA